MIFSLTILSGLAGIVFGQAIWEAKDKKWRNCSLEYFAMAICLAALVFCVVARSFI